MRSATNVHSPLLRLREQGYEGLRLDQYGPAPAAGPRSPAGSGADPAEGRHGAAPPLPVRLVRWGPAGGVEQDGTHIGGDLEEPVALGGVGLDGEALDGHQFRVDLEFDGVTVEHVVGSGPVEAVDAADGGVERDLSPASKASMGTVADGHLEF